MWAELVNAEGVTSTMSNQNFGCPKGQNDKPRMARLRRWRIKRLGTVLSSADGPGSLPVSGLSKQPNVPALPIARVPSGCSAAVHAAGRARSDRVFHYLFDADIVHSARGSGQFPLANPRSFPEVHRDDPCT